MKCPVLRGWSQSTHNLHMISRNVPSYVWISGQPKESSCRVYAESFRRNSSCFCRKKVFSFCPSAKRALSAERLSFGRNSFYLLKIPRIWTNKWELFNKMSTEIDYFCWKTPYLQKDPRSVISAEIYFYFKPPSAFQQKISFGWPLVWIYLLLSTNLHGVHRFSCGAKIMRGVESH